MQREDANDEEHGGRGRRGNGINIECNVGGERVSQWTATDVRGVRGQIQGTLRAPLGQVGRIQGTLRGAITKGSGTLGKGPVGGGGGGRIWGFLWLVDGSTWVQEGSESEAGRRICT